MNNTINNNRLTRSNPSFGSFSQEAKKFINRDSIEKLVKIGKISLSDVDYLAKHKLEIDVRRTISKGNQGLCLLSPYEEPYSHRELTPHTDTFFAAPKFKDIGKTLHIALNKAVKIAKKFDRFEKVKEDFLSKNRKVMNHLYTLKSDYTGMMKAETQLIIDEKSKLTKEDIDALAQHLNSATKSLSVFEKKEEKLDTKIRSVFSWWRF